MASQFVKYGNTYLRQSDSGELFPVSDAETRKALDAGYLGYSSIPSTRALTFGNSSSVTAGSSGSPAFGGAQGGAGTGPADIGALIKEKLAKALTNYSGVTNTAELETRRQELLRKQLLSAPYSAEGESTLTGAQKLSLTRGRGSEFEPEIKSLEEQIVKARNGDQDSLGNIAKLISIAKDTGVLGGEAVKKDTSLTEVNGRRVLVDNQTGAVIKDLGVVKGEGEGGLTPAQINTTVNSIAGAFDNEPIVKAYNTTQEGFQTINTIGTQTSSPADDIAFIYAFAKIMDPNSVVREGEYNTIQRYAQTWADNFGFSAKRLFSNTNFLTPDAKQKMLNALAPKVKTLSKQYDNLNAEYQRQINDAYAGKPRTITKYEVKPEEKKPAAAPIFDPSAVFDEVMSSTPKASNWVINLWNDLF